MKCIKIDLPREVKTIKIYVISDWHIGSPKTNYKVMEEMVKAIKEDDEAYCILNGDLIDNSTKDSV